MSTEETTTEQPQETGGNGGGEPAMVSFIIKWIFLFKVL